MRKCEVCKRKVNPRTMRVYAVEREQRLRYVRQYCTDCTHCGARIILRTNIDQTKESDGK